MTMRKRVGIIGTGSYLPDAVRGNGWWPEHVVERWRARDADSQPRAPEGLSEGERLVWDAMSSLRSDVFRGAVERRVLDAASKPSDGEIEAARRALADAGVPPSDVDLVLTSSFVPDHLNVPNAFRIHRELGLPARCFVSGLDAGCNALPLQLALAEQMIAGGQARCALLVQSSMLSRLLPYDEPFSTCFGDGAAAVVLGAVEDGFGIVGRSHFVNGGDCGALVAGVPGKDWYEEGRSYWYQAEKSTVFRMLLSVADIGRQALRSALEAADRSPAEVDFLACHQGTPWFREVVQHHTGLENARTLDTFPLTASLVGANIGLILDMARREGTLRRGDLVAMFASGVGTTWSSVVMRWAR